MDCFPLDEEIEASIPFSNNSVVLAATALLQRLVTYADERDLRSVDVLLTAVWLLLRNEKSDVKDEPILDDVVCEKIQVSKMSPNPACLYKTSFAEAETQTENNIYMEKGKIGNTSEKEQCAERTGCHSNNMDHFEICDCDSCTTACKIVEKNTGISDRETNDPDENEIGSPCLSTNSKSQAAVENKTNYEETAATHLQNFIENSTAASFEFLSKLNNGRSTPEKTTFVESDFEHSPPVLSPVKQFRETVNNYIQKELPNEQLIPALSTVDNKTMNSVAYSKLCSNAPLEAIPDGKKSPANSVIRSLLESHTCTHKKPDTLVKTSDGKTFQISSNNGLTFEDSFVIETVDTDDSDVEMNLGTENNQTVCNRVGQRDTNLPNLLMEKVNGLQTAVEEYDKETLTGCNRNKMANSCTETGSNEKVGSSKLPIDEESRHSEVPEKLNRNLFGGILSPDNDSELKIINIAGGVTFYDDNEETLPNDRIIDYIETKPGTSIYNPFSYPGLSPIQSSCTSLYSDVVFSSYSPFPGTYMSPGPRLSVQNCPQYLLSNNLNIEGDLSGRLYQTAENTYRYENIQTNFSQGFQYYLPEANSTNFFQPLQVKSESRVITPTKSKSKKKKKKSGDVPSPVKDYYNVRDPKGKFIKVDKAPYVNNLTMYSKALSKSQHQIKHEPKSEATSDDRNQPSEHLKMDPDQNSGADLSVSQGKSSGNQENSDAKGTTRLSISQLQKQCKDIDKKLKALVANKSVKAKKNLSEKEKKLHKANDKKRLTLLKKLKAQKKNLMKLEQSESVEEKPIQSENLKYVVRDKGTRVNSAGMLEEYTVVTIKGLLPENSGQNNASQDDQNPKQNQEPYQGNLKKTISVKKRKQKQPLKTSLSVVGGKLPFNSSDSTVKSAKQKAAVKKILKIKQAKSILMKEVSGKSKEKLKETVGSIAVSDFMPKAIETESTKTGEKKHRGGKPRKGQAAKKANSQIKHESQSVNKTKKAKKTRTLTQLVKAKKQKEQEEAKELIFTYQGERGAKLAAQQRISAYNESLSSDAATKGEN